MGRFILYVFLAFTTAFAGVFWASRGFPTSLTSAPRFVMPAPSPAEPSFAAEHAKTYERKQWESEHTAQSDKNPKLDKIRLEALQAAGAYEMSPCDSTMKSNLVSALTAYTRAWQSKLDCPRATAMAGGCDGKLKDAVDTFTTPLDRRVLTALAAAFRQRGIVRADFAADVREYAFEFAGSTDESPICLPRQRGSASPTR